MPNHIGAFLKASKCFSGLGINITRVSYNKAVDSHTLFIDAEGTEEQLKKADVELGKIGYLHSKNGYRESNPLHKPYINICKILTSYQAVNPDKITALWNDVPNLTEPLAQIGFFNFEEFHFEVYEGKGGHLPGEIVLIDYAHHIAFTGDIYINMHGLTVEQAEYNQYAPILMTSVDTDSKLCQEERKAIIQRLGVGHWQIFGAHGFKKDYSVGS